MKAEDTEVKYRPELAEKLSEYLKLAEKFYKINFKKAYYIVLSMLCEKEDPEQCAFLKEVANCFDGSIFGNEIFYERYEDELRNKYHIETISTARAAYVIYGIGEAYFEKMEESIKLSELSKMEQYMVQSFFKKLKAPMRNPNIEIKPGETKCYYDKDYSSDFTRDLKLSLEYLNRECQSTINIFATPD